MNKKLIISLGLAAIISTAAYAETTIYTDGIGRMHFLGRDAAHNQATSSKYSNSAEQDLTRRLYEQTAGETTIDSTYDQHPLKNYENTFPSSRFNTAEYWRAKYSKMAEDGAKYNKDTVKTTVTTTKGQTDYSGQYAYGSTFLNNTDENAKNEVKTTSKKHWWNKKKK